MNINYAIVSAFERSKEQGKKQRSWSQLFAIALMLVFFVALMGGLASGAAMYKHVSDAHAQVNDARLQSGLLANTVHVNDAVDSVGEGKGPEGRSLVLAENIDGNAYETRIYRYEGHIVQEYAISGKEYAPTRATKLFKSDTFDFSLNGQLLTISTDQGSFDIALRSQQRSVL